MDKEELMLLLDNLRDSVLKLYNYPEILSNPEVEAIITSKDWVIFIENLTKLKIHLK